METGKLVEWFGKQREKGFSEEEIVQMMLEAGHSKETIREVFQQATGKTWEETEETEEPEEPEEIEEPGTIQGMEWEEPEESEEIEAITQRMEEVQETVKGFSQRIPLPLLIVGLVLLFLLLLALWFFLQKEPLQPISHMGI